MKALSNGSTVLLILILMGTLTLFLMTTLQECTFFSLFIAKQVSVERHNSLGQGLLWYGIAQAKRHYDLLIEPQDAEIEVPLPDSLGRITLTGTKEGVAIASELLNEAQVVFKASCQLSRNSDKEFIVQGFQR